MSMIIVTDSSSDIRGKEIDELNIKVVPLNVSFGQKNSSWKKVKENLSITSKEHVQK